MIAYESLVRAIEENIPEAKSFINFWVAQEVIQKNPEVLGEPEILEWEVDGVPQPSEQQLQQWVDALEPEPQPIPIPASVTRRQGRLALLQAGKLEAVEQAVSEAGLAAQINYEAETWDRDNALLVQLWTDLGGTETELDELFILAAGL